MDLICELGKWHLSVTAPHSCGRTQYKRRHTIVKMKRFHQIDESLKVWNYVAVVLKRGVLSPTSSDLRGWLTKMFFERFFAE